MGNNTDLKNLEYPEDSAGRIMTTEYVELIYNMTVADAFTYIQEVGREKQNIYTCYVVNKSQKLIGMVSARTLLLSDQDLFVVDIMEPNVLSANVLDDQESLMSDIVKYGFIALPVVDDDRKLVGVFTYDDAFNVQEEEVTEDFRKMAAVSPSEVPYLSTGVFKLSMQRIPWLLLLTIFASITGFIVESYEESLAVLPALVAFVPMLMNTGGNAGTQSSTVIIRGMALGEIGLVDSFKVTWKELSVSFIVGAMLFVTTYVSVLFFGEGSVMAITVCLAMLATIIISNLTGVFLTFLAKLIKVDPAVMAAPLLTNIIDALALIVYFSLARAILRI
ncbi:MAG: magnesium transporter [Eubacteriaceae bacterium]|nr:magnesium transporter [Eubacteriaceae bacterium]